MAKLCPCQDDMANDVFMKQVLYLDCFQFLPLFIFPMIGLIISCKDNGAFISAYFRFYAWFRITLLLILLGGFSAMTYFGIMFRQEKKQSIYLVFFGDPWVLYTIATLFVPLFIWNVYLSTGFLESSVIIKKDVEMAIAI